MSETDSLLGDFRNFFHKALYRTKGVKPTRVQYSICEWISAGSGTWDNAPRFRFAAGLRGVAKSLIAYSYDAWRIWRNYVERGGHPDINTSVVTGTRDLADSATGFIQDLFYILPELRCLIPENPRRWSRTQMDVAGAIPQPAPTLYSRGVFGRMTGDRSDCTIFDDIEIPQNSETQGQREKLRRRAAEFMDVLKPGGEIVGLGTPQMEDSIIDMLPEWGFEVRMWPAEYPTAVWMGYHAHKLAPMLREDLEKDPSIVGQPTEPTRFGVEELAIKKAGGASRYALQYMLDTSLADAGRYPLKLRDLIVTDLDSAYGPEQPLWAGSEEYRCQSLPCVGLTGDFFHSPLGIVDNEFVPYDYKIMAIDPSGKGADETAYAVLATIGGYLYLLEIGGRTAGYDDITMDWLVGAAARHKIQGFVVEDNFGGGMFTALLERKVQERVRAQAVEDSEWYVPDPTERWVGAMSEEVKHHTQKELRIIDSLEPVMNQHRLVVNTGVVLQDDPGLGEGGEARRLFHQMTRITRTKGALVHYDRLDALAMGVRHLTDRMRLVQSEIAGKRRAEAEDKMWEEYWDNILGGGSTRPNSWAVNRAMGHFDR